MLRLSWYIDDDVLWAFKLENISILNIKGVDYSVSVIHNSELDDKGSWRIRTLVQIKRLSKGFVWVGVKITPSKTRWNHARNFKFGM